MTEPKSEKKPISRRFSRRWLLAGLGATALVTAGTAIAQESTPTPNGLPAGLDQLIARVAEKLGIEQDALRAAVMETLEESGISGDFGNGKPHSFGRRDHFKRRGHRGFWGHGVFVGAAADYVGLDQEAFIQRVRDGESPAQIAEAEGKSREGLVQALADSVRSKLDGMVQEGKLTREQVDAKLAHFEAKIGYWVDGAFPGRKWRRREPEHDEPADISSSL